jgi:hypothetical protein
MVASDAVIRREWGICRVCGAGCGLQAAQHWRLLTGHNNVYVCAYALGGRQGLSSQWTDARSVRLVCIWGWVYWLLVLDGIFPFFFCSRGA